MPSVASEVAVQPSKRPEPLPGRLGPSAPTPSTPFDRVLDAATNPPSPPPRADRPERTPASDQPANADAPAPAESKDGRSADPSPCAPAEAADSVETADGLAPVSSQALPQAASPPAEIAVPIVTAATDKDADAVATDGTDPAATPDDAKSADAKSADAVASTITGATTMAPDPALFPAATLAVIAIPVVSAVVPHPKTPSADEKIAAASQPIALATDAGVAPAQVHGPQAPVAAEAVDEKASAPKEQEIPANIASAVAAKVAEPVQPEAAAPTVSVRTDGKIDKPKSEPGRSERAPTLRPGRAPAAQSADMPSDAADKPTTPVARPHAPVADHTAAAARLPLGEAREAVPAGAVPAQPNAVLPVGAAAAPAFAMPTLTPITALRVDTAPNLGVPLAGLAVEIVSRAHEGLKRFDIRLDPPELGRIDVRLDVDHDGRVTSRLIVERADTLDLLRRDAPSLERALQQAGLKTDGGIDFSLRDQSQSFRDQAPRDTAPITRLIIPDDELPASDAVRGYGRLIGLGGGIDIRV